MMSDETTDRHGAADDELVRCARTNRDAFGHLFDRYYPRVLGYCLRRLCNRALAEDATSETFLSVAAHMPSFGGRTETDFRRWLFRIATNAVRAHVRQESRRQELLEAAVQKGRLPRGETAAGGPDDSVADAR